MVPYGLMGVLRTLKVFGTSKARGIVQTRGGCALHRSAVCRYRGRLPDGRWLVPGLSADYATI